MNYQDFAYWLQGFFELSNPESITEEQTRIIKRHLDLCFVNVTRAGRGTGSCGTNGGTCGTGGVSGIVDVNLQGIPGFIRSGGYASDNGTSARSGTYGTYGT